MTGECGRAGARIESLLSARLFLVPQPVGDRLYFVSNLSGRLSLYSMRLGGSVPEPLLPPDVALQNPALIEGGSFVVYPKTGRVLVMIDRDGDELYQPMLVPLAGGYPEPAFPGVFEGQSVSLTDHDVSRSVAYLHAQSRADAVNTAYRADLAAGVLERIGQSRYGAYPVGSNADHTRTVLIDAYGAGDHVLYLREAGREDRDLLFGVPLEKRAAGACYPPNSISRCEFVEGDRALLFVTSLHCDTYGLGRLALTDPIDVVPIAVRGTVHEGQGELTQLRRLRDDRFAVLYNIDGCSWLYEGVYRPGEREVRLERVICGAGALSGGVLSSFDYDPDADRYALSFSTATSPTQIYTVEGATQDVVERHTEERVLGLSAEDLSPGEDASFESFDGLRVSARLYLPASSRGFEGPRPLVYYLHGGPQSQERPDFAWFSMPLIQLLTLRGFAVFVPNARGSTGYGFDYMKRVVRDWGGEDRLDHVHAMARVLPKDPRLDVRRAGVVGRSYGGFMTLTLAGRDPSLWAAAVDMFGPYDLVTFAERVPETWKPYMAFLLGDPVTERDFLVERSPATYLGGLACPLLVIQGKNDPRVVESESRRLVEELRSKGKSVEYLMFEDEGHDVLKFENRVRCYEAIAGFFERRLRP